MDMGKDITFKNVKAKDLEPAAKAIIRFLGDTPHYEYNPNNDPGPENKHGFHIPPKSTILSTEITPENGWADQRTLTDMYGKDLPRTRVINDLKSLGIIETSTLRYRAPRKKNISDKIVHRLAVNLQAFQNIYRLYVEMGIEDDIVFSNYFQKSCLPFWKDHAKKFASIMGQSSNEQGPRGFTDSGYITKMWPSLFYYYITDPKIEKLITNLTSLSSEFKNSNLDYPLSKRHEKLMGKLVANVILGSHVYLSTAISNNLSKSDRIKEKERLIKTFIDLINYIYIAGSIDGIIRMSNKLSEVKKDKQN